jgi:predicted metal-dependent HD superfamily phosphohydrolase
MRTPLGARFVALCGRLCPDASPGGAELAYLVLESLYAHGGGSPRLHHTLRHVAECLEALDAAREEAEYADEVEFALYAHDAVYDARRKDNEARSAAVAAMLLHDLGAPAEVNERVCGLIEATAHTRVGPGRDERLIVDADLSILGSEAGRYDEYAVAIRKEFAHADDALYRAGRCAFLRAMLARERVFALGAMRDRYEAAARRNMGVELGSLAVAEAPAR